MISVIIPVYNGEHYLAAAIESALAQSMPPAEILIINDGSVDQSAKIATAFGDQVHLYTQEHAGVGAARNRGVSLAQGEFLAFLDADDLWLPDKLAHQLACLRDQPWLDIVFGQVEQFISPDLPLAQYPALPPKNTLPGVIAGAMLIRRERFAAVGAFATDWTVGEFIEWYGRATSAGLQSLILPEVVMRRRLHATNMTRHNQAHHSDYHKIIKANLAKRRAQTREQTEVSPP
ncbi:MAG: glycosyltransferase family 2 protein [Caldilineaceae bacterium]|nr:glycosyltransferase family 2 protein [Caldilineaceae bacterium]